VRDKVLNWNRDHEQPTAKEIKAEIKRLQNLLLSHKALEEVNGLSNIVQTRLIKNADCKQRNLSRCSAE
jgi:hypothetical protein